MLGFIAEQTWYTHRMFEMYWVTIMSICGSVNNNKRERDDIMILAYSP